MREIRPIRGNEGDDFLRLLCNVFELDFNRAQRIFYTEPLFDLNRKWALLENGQILSILTTVPLAFGWGRAIGIAGVATRSDCQKKGLAGDLLCHVLSDAAARGEGSVLLFARRKELYERIGFQELDVVRRGRIDHVDEVTVPDVIAFDDVQTFYNTWAASHPDRLQRDHRRWNYWKWNLRICTALGGGYVCMEGGMVRECILLERPEVWPMPDRTEWLGLSSMAEQVGIPLVDERHELFLMGHNFPGVPQMFMTDQF